MEIIDNRFRVIKKIYNSEIADTYLTEDVDNNDKLVDVKILIVNKYINNTLFNMFKIETLVIRDLEFDGLPKYITHNEVEDDEKYFYVASEHIKGISLKELLTNDFDKVKDNFFEIVTKLLDILEYMEGKRIIHKTISSENILLDDNLNPYLINFGAIRNKLNSGRAIEPVIGNTKFMPTEQKLGFANPRSDQYALGYLLIDMLLKYNKNTLKESVDSLNNLGYIPPNLKEFIKILINKDSTERFVTIEQAKTIFNKIKNNEDVNIDSGHTDNYKNDAEDEFIARKIVETENSYMEIEKHSNKKGGKGTKILLYLAFLGFWIYLIYYMLGFLVNMVEIEDKSYKNYHKKSDKLIKIYKNK